MMRAIETAAAVSGVRDLHLDTPLPQEGVGKVRVIVLFPEGDAGSVERAWLRLAMQDPGMREILNPSEDRYTLEDGIPFVDEE